MPMLPLYWLQILKRLLALGPGCVMMVYDQLVLPVLVTFDCRSTQAYLHFRNTAPSDPGSKKGGGAALQLPVPKSTPNCLRMVVLAKCLCGIRPLRGAHS